MIPDPTERLESHAVMRMPDDMADAFDGMKLAIMRNRMDGWREFSEDDTLQVLWLLMQIAMDKTGPDAPGHYTWASSRLATTCDCSASHLASSSRSPHDQTQGSYGNASLDNSSAVGISNCSRH